MNRKSLNLLKTRISELNTALERGYSFSVRQRLHAVKMFLEGAPLSHCAAFTKTNDKKILLWADAIKEHGCIAVIKEHRPIGTVKKKKSARRPRSRVNPLSVSAVILRGLAAKEKSRKVKRRLRALSRIADGATQKQAAAYSKACETAVSNWVKKFRAGGVAALRDKRLGRPPAKRSPHG